MLISAVALESHLLPACTAAASSAIATQHQRAHDSSPWPAALQSAAGEGFDVCTGSDAAVSTGTTIMAMAFDGGVVLGADTRTSAGSYIVNRASRKISQLSDRIFVCRSGSAADTQALTGYVKLYLQQHTLELAEGRMPQVTTAANLFKLMCYPNKHILTAGLIIAGWDDRNGGQVFSIPLGGSLVPVPYTAGGSGSVFISGLLDSEYRPNMSKDECTALVSKCVAHAMARDGSSGGLIRLTIVTRDSVEEEVLSPATGLPFQLA